MNNILPKIIGRQEYNDLETDRNNLLAKVTGLETEVLNLKNMSKTMTEDHAQHNIVIANLKTENEKAVTELKAVHEKQIADFKTDYEKQISDLKTTVNKAETSSEAKAISIVAKIGIPEAELPKVITDKTQVLDEAAKLQGSALSEFFDKNKKAISKALKEKASKKVI